MRKWGALLFSVIVALLLISACGDGQTGTETSTPDRGGNSAATPDLSSTPSSSPGAASATAVDQQNGAQTSVTALTDVADYLAQYEGEEIIEVQCAYDPDAGLIDCDSDGLYDPEPLPIGENTRCRVLLVNDDPIAVSCTTDITAIYYMVP